VTASRSRSFGIALAMSFAASHGVAIAADDTVSPLGNVNTRFIAVAPGTLNSATMTTVSHCTNFGSVPAKITTAFYEFDNTFICSTGGIDLVAPGHSRTSSIVPIASMVTDFTCGPSAAPIAQGVAYVVGDITMTLKIRCTVRLVAIAGDPPSTLERLSLYLKTGAPLTDILFADSLDP
jgi:hypothetical protein